MLEHGNAVAQLDDDYDGSSAHTQQDLVLREALIAQPANMHGQCTKVSLPCEHNPFLDYIACCWEQRDCQRNPLLDYVVGTALWW